MTLRDHISRQKRWAHQILDQVKQGMQVSAKRVKWALCVLGDVE